MDDTKIRAAADGLVRTGLAAHGYSYVNIDSCWQGSRGGPLNAIQPNRKSPDMRSLADTFMTGAEVRPLLDPLDGAMGLQREGGRVRLGGPGLIGCSSGAPDPDYRPNTSRRDGMWASKSTRPRSGAMDGMGSGFPQVRLVPHRPEIT